MTYKPENTAIMQLTELLTNGHELRGERGRQLEWLAHLIHLRLRNEPDRDGIDFSPCLGRFGYDHRDRRPPGGGTSGSKTVTAKLPAITRLWFLARVLDGASGMASMNISALAHAGNVAKVTSSMPLVATVPTTFTFPLGATAASFAVPTVPVLATVNVTVTGTVGSATKWGTLGVKTPTFSKLSLSPTSVKAEPLNQPARWRSML